MRRVRVLLVGRSIDIPPQRDSLSGCRIGSIGSEPHAVQSSDSVYQCGVIGKLAIVSQVLEMNAFVRSDSVGWSVLTAFSFAEQFSDYG